MVTAEKAMDVKRRRGDHLQQHYAAHAIMVARDAKGSYFLKLLVPPGSARGKREEVVEGVPLEFEDSQPFQAFSADPSTAA